MANGKRFLGAVLLLVLGAACSSVRGVATIRERTDDGKQVTPTPLNVLLTERPELAPLRDVSVMSAAVYIDAPLDAPLNLANSGLPPLSNDWVEDTGVPRLGPLDGQRQTRDLTYRLWVNARTNVAVLVFRGTHIPADWYSNLRWFDFWIPNVEDHYEQTERATQDIVRYVKTAHPGAAIIAAGHSLGGGLAQTAAYTACGEIKTVFAFDSTPVTKHRAANSCASGRPETFYRVFEQSEILSYARFLVRLALRLRKADPHIAEVKVHVFEGFGVRAHSMQKLALQLDHYLVPAAASR